MREVAADAAPHVVGLGGTAHGAGMLVAELEMVMDEVADRLHAPPAAWRLAEQLPRLLHHAIGLAVAAAGQEYERLMWQLADRVLFRREIDDVGPAGIDHHRTGGD